MIVGVPSEVKQDEYRVGLRPVSELALAGLRSLQDRGYLADRSSSSSGPIADEIERLLLWYLQSVLERPLETAAFLDELRSQGPAGPR